MSEGSFSDRREAFKRRTKAFAIAAIKFCATLPQSQVGRNIDNQLTRSAMSIASNYRAACRARSGAESLAKLGIVEEEGDESLLWLEFCVDLKIGDQKSIAPLLDEGNQILSIIVSSRKKMKERLALPKQPKIVREGSAGEDLFGDMPFEEG